MHGKLFEYVLLNCYVSCLSSNISHCYIPKVSILLQKCVVIDTF